MSAYKTNISVAILTIGLVFALSYHSISKNTLSYKLTSNMTKIAMNKNY